MDGEQRYAIVRDHIRQQHDLASRKRAARRFASPASAERPVWTSGVVAVVGSLTRRAAGRPLTS